MNSRTYNDKLTVIIVSFPSNQIIENLINVIEKNIKVLVIENSLDKNRLENYYTEGLEQAKISLKKMKN